MPLPSNPETVVVPVVSLSTVHGVDDLLGTAFLADDGLLVSAKHVLGVVPPAGYVMAAVDILGPAPPRPVPVGRVHLDPEYDVAVAELPGWPREEHLTIRTTNTINVNRTVLSVEYSPSEASVLPDKRRAMRFAPNYHQGHVVRAYTAELGHQRPTECIDVSFPAFRRASGAPVIDGDDGEVVGMIVGNVERHLMPAHMERIERDDDVVEEIRYFLPHGQAIRAEYLLAALDEARQAFA